VGTRPAPIVDALDVVKEKGRIVVGADLRVPGHEAVWALGDCASVPNAEDADVCPGTAQFADRQGRHAADNIVCAHFGRATTPFAYSPLGQLCSIGGHRAVAELFGFQVSGVLAWLLWRAVYVAKMPAWSRRLQVAFDWAWLALFPRDLSHVRPRVTERVSHAHYAPGDFVFERGDEPRAFYVIERGEVEVIRPTPRHPEGEVVALLGPEAFFGEQALVSERPRAASVRARTSVDVLVMGRDIFTQVSKRLTPLRDAFAHAVAARSVDVWAERDDLVDALERIALDDVLDPVPRPLLAPTTRLREAMAALAGTGSEALIVSADGVRMDGVVTMADLLRAIGHGANPATEIGSIVSHTPPAVTLGDRATTAALMLQAEGRELIPVVRDPESRALVGCVRLRRLLRDTLARMDEV
jgi:NADH dehydrogenase